ncbi:hypothetical protein PVK06_034860 [Gossypium arboreum]|uniref:Uncharacterized protein n=1 Tax=Gossypium arboreum TaxID=29729 RepID=A0ABR0NFA9_GOSAR|nr:hypothetical protein PVK06_034860 [Gossypium arboreum]
MSMKASVEVKGSAMRFCSLRTEQYFLYRAFIYNGFLSSEECDHLIFLAKDKLEKSMVADDVSG